MKAKKKKMYRLVLARMIMAHLNNSLTVYVNTEVRFGDHRAPLQNLFRSVPEANPERARSANEIPVGTHDFEFADGVTDLDRADLRPGERNHFSEFTGRDEFNRRCAKYRTKRAIKRGRRPAALKVPENAYA
jgi:hypothetical protein